jgi:hypothetical protein
MSKGKKRRNETNVTALTPLILNYSPLPSRERARVRGIKREG